MVKERGAGAEELVWEERCKAASGREGGIHDGKGKAMGWQEGGVGRLWKAQG